MTLGAFAAIYFVQLAAAISPGVAILLAARTGLREGFYRSIWLSVGIGLGAATWAILALFGLSVLFQFAPAALSVLKILGAGYLLYMAVKMWRHAKDPIDAVDTKTRARSPLGLLFLGISTQLANPKPAIFFGTVFLTFIPADAPFWAYPIILLMVFINDTGCALLVAGLFSLDRTRLIYLSLKTAFERIFSGLLALLGLKLALL